MDEPVNVSKNRYEEYEELLLKRDRLRKDALNYRILYMHEFGELMTAVLKKTMECISLKKSIALCQQAENHGVCMAEKELQAYIDREMSEYHESLKALTEDYENCREIRYSKEADVLKAKALYRKLAKLLHPDINPETENSLELMDLWNRICNAYYENNYKELQDLEVLAGIALEKRGLNGKLPELPDIEERIAAVEEEIEKIRTTEPYLYKLLLDDVEATGEKRRSLSEELETYTEYVERLGKVLDSYKERGILR